MLRILQKKISFRYFPPTSRSLKSAERYILYTVDMNRAIFYNYLLSVKERESNPGVYLMFWSLSYYILPVPDAGGAGCSVYPQQADPPPGPQALQHHLRQPERWLQPQGNIDKNYSVESFRIGGSGLTFNQTNEYCGSIF